MKTLRKTCVFGVKVFFALMLFTTHVSAGPIIDGESPEPDPAAVAFKILNYRSLNRNFDRAYCAKFLKAKVDGTELPQNDKNLFCLDRFSRILTPEDVKQFIEIMKGEYFGLGIYLKESESGEVIVLGFVSEDSPSYEVMRADDIILSIRRADDVEGKPYLIPASFSMLP